MVEKGGSSAKKDGWLRKRVQREAETLRRKQRDETQFKEHLHRGARDASLGIVSRASRDYEFVFSLAERTLFYKRNILLINKPPYMTTQGEGDSFGLDELVRCATKEDFFVANRLDYNTSGVVVLAKGIAAAEEMAFQFAAKEKSGMKKEYQALLDGEFTKEGRQRVAVDIYEDRCKKMQVVNKNSHPEWDTKIQDTITFFEPKTLYETRTRHPQRRTLTSVELVTGRTHQIRVTAAEHLKMPIIGDTLYHPPPAGGSRQLLHSYRFSFTHPFTREYVTVEAPLPEDFQTVLDDMRVVKHYQRGITTE